MLILIGARLALILIIPPGGHDRLEWEGKGKAKAGVYLPFTLFYSEENYQ
jgi:hypothetical protein